MDYRLEESINCVSFTMVQEREPTAKLRTVNDAKSFVFGLLRDKDREWMVALFINARNKVTGWHHLAMGTISSTLVHPREVFAAALQVRASGIILAHNHPSGDSAPSREDLELTKRMGDAGHIIGIELLDHIIVGEHIFSMREQGILGDKGVLFGGTAAAARTGGAG